MSIGEQIRKYRKEAGMSQKELGKKLGISQQQIAQYENGKRIPKIETINSIAGALGMGVRRLYPEFSRDEWKKTETYKQSVNRYDTAKRGIIAMLAYKYGAIQEEIIDGEIYYTISKNGKKELISVDTMNSMLNFLIGIVPSIYELVKGTVLLTKESANETESPLISDDYDPTL